MPEPLHFDIYTDGSASNLGECAGAFCAIVVHNGVTFPPAVGVKVPGKIGGMEIQAVCAGLEAVRNYADKNHYYSGPGRVNIFTDSTYVVNCATGKMRRTANQAEWRRFDELARGIDLCIQHTNRNTIPQQAACDEIAGKLREQAEWVLRSYALSLRTSSSSSDSSTTNSSPQPEFQKAT